MLTLSDLFEVRASAVTWTVSRTAPTSSSRVHSCDGSDVDWHIADNRSLKPVDSILRSSAGRRFSRESAVGPVLVSKGNSRALFVAVTFAPGITAPLARDLPLIATLAPVKVQALP